MLRKILVLVVHVVEKDENFHETAKQRWQSKKKKKNTIKNNISMLRRMWCRVECSEREKKRTNRRKAKSRKSKKNNSY